MKEHQELINKFLEPFDLEGKTLDYDLKGINLDEDKDGNSIIWVEVTEAVPKLVLDEIRKTGYEVYSIRPVKHRQGELNIGFYKEKVEK